MISEYLGLILRNVLPLTSLILLGPGDFEAQKRRDNSLHDQRLPIPSRIAATNHVRRAERGGPAFIGYVAPSGNESG